MDDHIESICIHTALRLGHDSGWGGGRRCSGSSVSVESSILTKFRVA